MVFWRKISPGFFATFFALGLPIFAQRAPEKPDAKGVRDSLANAEAQHRDAYAASKFAEAIAAARGGLALADKAGTIADQVQFVRHLAYDNWLTGDLDSALDYSQRLLDCAETLNDNRIRAQGHRYLSQIFETIEDDARSRSHAEQSMRFAQRAGDEDLRIFALTAIGQSDARAKHYEAALRAFEESRAYWQKLKRPWNAINSLVNIADVAIARGDLSGALKRYEEILAARIENKDYSGQVRAVATVADLLRQLGRADEALPRLVATRELAESIGSHRVLAEFYGSLARVQEARQDLANALSAERVAASERELLGSERARLRATELEARLELVQKQEAINQLHSIIAVNEAKVRMANADLVQARAFRIAVIDGAIAIAVIGVAGWLVLRYRARHKRLVAAVSNSLKPWADRPEGDVH